MQFDAKGVFCVFPQDVTASSAVSCSQEKEGLPEKNHHSPVHSERDALLVGMLSYCISNVDSLNLQNLTVSHYGLNPNTCKITKITLISKCQHANKLNKDN